MVTIFAWIGVFAGISVMMSLAIWKWIDEWNRREALAVCNIFYWLFSLFAIPLTIAATTGAMPDYSQGYREGVIIKVSNKGVIWKTDEILVALGTKESIAFQEPVGFSIADHEILQKAKALTGENVVIHYDEWLMLPFRMGETDRLVTSIVLKKDE